MGLRPKSGKLFIGHERLRLHPQENENNAATWEVAGMAPLGNYESLGREERLRRVGCYFIRQYLGLVLASTLAQTRPVAFLLYQPVR
jgi:hypothetical protein